MFPYWLLLSVFAIGTIVHEVKPRTAVTRASPLFIVAALLTMLFVGLRYEVGADWFNYTEIHSATANLPMEEWLNYSDPGYMALNAVSHWLELDIWFVNLLCAFIFVWGLSQFTNLQPNPWLTITVAVPYLVIVVAMGYTRQAVAIGLILASFGYFERRQISRFLLTITVAASFHKTAIIVLPLIALSTVRHRFIVYAAATAIGSLIFTVFLDAFLGQMLDTYIEEQMSSEGAGIRVAMNIIPALIFLASPRRFTDSEQERAIWRNFSFASLAMAAALIILPSSTIVDRAALYLMPIQLFVLSRVPYAFSAPGRPNGLMMIMVLAYSAAIQFVWLTYATHAQAWLPYRVFPFFS